MGFRDQFPHGALGPNSPLAISGSNGFIHLPHYSWEFENKGEFRGSSYRHNTSAQ